MLLAVKLALIVVVGQIIEWIGKPRLTEWAASSVALFAPSQLDRQQKTLKTQILATQAELRGTSSQDEFAKWAKTRRKLDKMVADLETLKGKITQEKSNAAWFVTAAVFVITQVAPFFYTSRHSSTPVLYLPSRWFGPLEWFLALPFAPAGHYLFRGRELALILLGALSCAVWTMAVRRTIKISVQAIKSAILSSPTLQTAPTSVLNAGVSNEKEGVKEKAL